MIKTVFIIVPSASDESPIKGAAALANSLPKKVKVVFISLKHSSNDFELLNKDINHISLEPYSWVNKIKYIKQLLKHSGNRKEVATISSSFSADILNSFLFKHAITCSSVRGNLPLNYKDTYGKVGRLIAFIHLKRLRNFDHIVSMTLSMSKQVHAYTKRDSPVIGNFIDEKRIEKYRRIKKISNKYKFIYTGSFTDRKQPLVLINALSKINKDIDFEMDMFGDGPLLENAKNYSKELGLSKKIKFHGNIKEPYQYISAADLLILPSLSEGVPRSVLEALYFGIPCIIRNVDGNNELIQSGVNGELFTSDAELHSCINKILMQTKDGNFHNKNLLPNQFRQKKCAELYLKLISQ